MKNANKEITVTVRRVIFIGFLKASIGDLITLLSSSLQNSEGGGDGDSGDSLDARVLGIGMNKRAAKARLKDDGQNKSLSKQGTVGRERAVYTTVLFS